MKNIIEEMVQEIVDAYMVKAKEDINTAANYANDIMFKEANKMYNSFIKQFYLYKTTSYIRHWEPDVGTCKGTNLFYGNQIKKHSGKNPYIEINFTGEDMAGGYQYNTPDAVLENTIMGVRGVPPYWSVYWYGSYSSKYFSIGNTTMINAFKTFLRFYEKPFWSAFIEMFNKLGWK